MPRENKGDMTYTYNLTMSCVQTFASWTLLRLSNHLIHYVWSSKLYIYYKIPLLLLGAVIIFPWRNYYLYTVCTFILSVVNLCVIHTLISSPRRNTCNCWLANNTSCTRNSSNSFGSGQLVETFRIYIPKFIHLDTIYNCQMLWLRLFAFFN